MQRCAGCTLLSRELRRVGLDQAWTLRLRLVWSHQNGLLYKVCNTNCSLVWSHIIMINIPKGRLRCCKICHPHIERTHRHSEFNIDSVSQGDTIWPLSYHNHLIIILSQSSGHYLITIIWPLSYHNHLIIISTAQDQMDPIDASSMFSMFMSNHFKGINR